MTCDLFLLTPKLLPREFKNAYVERVFVAGRVELMTDDRPRKINL